MDNTLLLQEVKKITGRQLKCKVPFEQLQLFPNGSVCACCPALVSNYTLGNIFEQSFEEIWYGERAQAFRKSIIEHNFQFCNLNSCIQLDNLTKDWRYSFHEAVWQELIMNIKKPREVHFNIDECCNANCIMCRDKHITKTEGAERYKQIIDNKLLPLLSDAEIIYINGAGELFASSLCRELIKKVVEQYPKIKFNIITNGILANRENFEELGLIDRIHSLEVSMHSYSEETYNKIVRNGNYQKVMDNLKFLSVLHKQGKIKYFHLNYVVMSYNYKEMIDFQKFANKIDAFAHFWEYRTWGHTELDKIYNEVAVFEPTHPEYKEYLKIVENKIFDNNCNINNKLRPIIYYN